MTTSMSRPKQLVARLLLQQDCTLGEGPFWNARTERLHWVDILACRLHGCRADGSGHAFLEVPSHLGAAAPWGEGFLCATQEGLGLLDDKGAFRSFLQSSRLPAHLRFNDGKVDPTGHFWVGSMAYDCSPGAGALYRMEGEGDLVQMLDAVTISNGLAWDLSCRRMYFIDTATRGLDAFDWEPATGRIEARRRMFTFTEADGWPDGMTLDAKGRLWIAFWDGWKVLCLDPDTGEVAAEVALPVQRPTSCAFGPDGKTLYITSARVDLSPAAREMQPLAGSLFCVSTDAAP